jgi:hypothetical protein
MLNQAATLVAGLDNMCKGTTGTGIRTRHKGEGSRFLHEIP